MKDYKKPLRLRDKLKKSLGMKVRQKYEPIPCFQKKKLERNMKRKTGDF